MRKIIGIFIVMVLIGTSILPTQSLEINTVNNKVNQNDCGCLKYKQNITFLNPLIMNRKIKLTRKDYNLPNIQKIEIPEYFNWMDYEGQDWTIPVRNQGICGSCWAFAALAALECVINIREGIADLDPDLSEQYVLSCLTEAGSCLGGDSDLAFKYIYDTGGNIIESCFPYQNTDPNGNDWWGNSYYTPVFCDDKCKNWGDYLVPILEYGLIPCEDRELAKSTIMQIGPVCAYFLDNMDFDIWIYSHNDPDDYYPYEYKKYVNHAVIIVGWKDDPSIEQGGYWICKNSFGPNIGYNGFFNIEYGSMGLEIYDYGWVDYDPSSYDWHPLPKTNGPYYSLIDNPIEFKGNASGEHPPFTWYWKFGDQTSSVEQNPTHIYTSPGKYIVNLTVTDKNNNVFSDTTFAWIQETNLAPAKPNIEGPSTIKKNVLCFYNISVNDPDGSDVYLYFEVFDMPGLWTVLMANDSTALQGGYWRERDNFLVRAKTLDPYGAESDWAILEVTVPKSRSISDFNPWFSRLIKRFPILEFLL